MVVLTFLVRGLDTDNSSANHCMYAYDAYNAYNAYNAGK